jgi:hypothetical protein
MQMQEDNTISNAESVNCVLAAKVWVQIVVAIELWLEQC